jgi:lysophospholipase L1-like esterase
MKADVIDLKPAILVVLGGTNDLARGVNVVTIENNLALIADLAVANKITPIFASILPVSDYHKDKNPNFEHTTRRQPVLIRTINSWLENFCGNRGFIYLDYYSAMVDPAGFLKADLADDGLHPNSAGYRVMAPLVLQAIEKAVPKPPPQQKTKKRRLLF